MPTKQDDRRDEFVGDGTDSYLDLKVLRMIESGTTQVEVSIEEGSRTITIPVNHDLL